MFRRLPPQGGDQRAVAEIVNNIMDGKTNNTGVVTLATGGASTTTITDARIGAGSVILLSPTDDISSTAYYPYLAVQDTTNQVAPNTTGVNIITFNATDYALGASLVDNTKLTVGYAGLYNIQFSIQFVNATTSHETIDVWFRKNGTDIAASNSKFGMSQRKSSGDNSHDIGAMNFFVALQKDDYIQLAWRPSSTSTSIEYFAAGTSPTRPATPSVIATMSYLSSNGYTSNIYTNPYISSVSNGSAVISHPANSIAGKTFDYVVVG